MKKKYNFITLPKDMVLFIDHSAFQLEDYKRIYKSVDMKNPSIDYLKANYSRLVELIQNLYEMENWITTRDIVTEFRGGNIAFKKKVKSTSCRQIKKIYQRTLSQRIKILPLLEDNYRLADCNLTPDLKRITNYNKKLVEKIFNNTLTIHKTKRNGETPDIELINFALAHAIQAPLTGIFANNLHLLRTFARCAKKLNLSDKTFCLADRLREPIKTKDIRPSYF